VDEQARVGSAGRHLAEDPVERERAIREAAAERHSEDEKCRREPSGDGDLDLTELVERQRLARDDDRAVPGTDRSAVRKQRVASLDERVRRERKRRHLELPVERPFVQHLDVLGEELEPEAARRELPGSERPDHEGVVRVRGMADPDQHGSTLDCVVWPSPH
jgi:hypothetical protein